ncbi:MAG TPA: hypothetical protein VJ819_18190 [Nocardioidaceae bacterium]|nr:hypothetical protein [Nocardioidaceae bacterium]
MRGAQLTGLGLTAAAVLVLPLTPVPTTQVPVGARTTDVAHVDGGDRLDRGTWTVTRVDNDRYRVSWRSPTRLPVVDSRPEILHGDATHVARVTSHGRRVTATVTTRVAPEAADLGVLQSGSLLDAHAPAPQPPTPQPRYTAPRMVERLAVDPGQPGPFQVTSSDYRLPGFTVRRMPRPVEMLGHVVRPADGQLAADAPLVLFLHGRHDFCYDPDGSGRFSFRWPCRNGTRPVPSHLGYDYVQRLLAGQGFVTVSVAANGINAQDDRALDGGAEARARLVRRHLRQWVDWAEDDRYPVDLDSVVLVGHSRGGEGVNRASLVTSLGAPYRIAGQVLLAPTNFARQTTAYVPTITVLPYCDGDVVDLQGQSYTDLARDLTRDDTSLKSSVLVMGANHNYFNTEWTPGLSAAPSFDDSGGGRHDTCGAGHAQRLSAAGQRRVARTYIAGAVQLMTGRDPRALAMFDGTTARIGSAGNADVRTQALGGGRVLRRPGLDAALAKPVGAYTLLCDGRSDTRRPEACGRELAQIITPHWVSGALRGVPSTRAFEMSWDRVGQRGGLRFDDLLDASVATSLDLRTVVDPERGDVRVKVRLVDADGRTATLVPEAGGRVPALPEGRTPYLGKLIAQTLRVPLSGVREVDLSRIVGVDVIGYSSTGRIWVLDVAAVPGGALPPVPRERLPLVSIGTVRRTEGDRPGTSVIDLPFTLSAPAVKPGRFVVTGFDQYDGRPIAKRTVTVLPGQSGGSIRFDYRANRIDDLRTRGYGVTVSPVRNVMTRSAFGRVLIADDDPRPSLTLRPTAPGPVEEGEPLSWTVTLAAPVGYDVVLTAETVTDQPSGAVPLRVGDLPARYRERTGLGRADPELPLHRAGVFLFDVIRAGHTTGTLSLPMRRDAVREPEESLRLRVSVPQFHRARLVTGRVRDVR